MKDWLVISYSSAQPVEGRFKLVWLHALCISTKPFRMNNVGSQSAESESHWVEDLMWFHQSRVRDVEWITGLDFYQGSGRPITELLQLKARPTAAIKRKLWGAEEKVVRGLDPIKSLQSQESLLHSDSLTVNIFNILWSLPSDTIVYTVNYDRITLYCKCCLIWSLYTLWWNENFMTFVYVTDRCAFSCSIISPSTKACGGGEVCVSDLLTSCGDDDLWLVGLILTASAFIK